MLFALSQKQPLSGHYLATCSTLFMYAVVYFGYFGRRMVLFSSPEPKAHGELIVYQLICRPSVNIFKLQYLRNQWSNRNQILSEASLGCIRFWTRSDQKIGVHGN